MKDKLQKRFEALYPECRLFCIHLDGFSHTVYYKDKNNNKKIEGYSAYAPEQYDDFDDGIHGWNRDQCKALFAGVSHYSYQHNAQEIIYENINRW